MDGVVAAQMWHRAHAQKAHSLQSKTQHIATALLAIMALGINSQLAIGK
jgi:hypothetical protein